MHMEGVGVASGTRLARPYALYMEKGDWGVERWFRYAVQPSTGRCAGSVLLQNVAYQDMRLSH
jgi:hypothetical protein